MDLIQWLSEPGWQHVGLTLVHFTWEAAAVAAGTFFAIRIFRLGHGTPRHAAYLAGLIAIALCPVLTWTAVTTGAGGAAPPAEMLLPTSDMAVSDEFTDEAGAFNGSALPSETGTSSSPAETMIRPAPAAAGIASDHSRLLTTILPWVTAGWLLGVGFFGMRLLAGIGYALQLRRGATALPDTLMLQAHAVAQRLGLRRSVRIAASSRVRQPMAIGCLKPIVLLPMSMLSELPAAVLEAMIAHELAHIRRHDLWINMLQRVIETLGFFHPAVWWLSRRLREEREICCDRLAVEATGEPVVYAEALETVARRLIRPAGAPVAAAAWNGGRSTLVDRVAHVLGMAVAPSPSRTWSAGAAAIVAAILALVTCRAAAPPAADEPAAAPQKFPVAFDEFLKQVEVEADAGPHVSWVYCAADGQVIFDKAHQGLQAAVFIDGELKRTPGYAVFNSTEVDERFADAIAELPDGAIVVLAVSQRLRPVRSIDFGPRAQAALGSLGAATQLAQFQPGDTYYCIGMKGLAPGRAAEKFSRSDFARYPVDGRPEGPRVAVRIMDDRTGEPIPDVRLRVVTRREVHYFATDAQGRATIDLTWARSPYMELIATKDGYRGRQAQWVNGAKPALPDVLVWHLEPIESIPGRVVDGGDDRIKVGVMMSHFTATGPHWTQGHYGWGHAEVANQFMRPEYDVYAVIEPGTREIEQVGRTLQKYGLSERWIDGSDSAELSKLDVIVGCGVRNTVPPVLDAITTAVRSGTDFLAVGFFAGVNPGWEPRLQTLLGLTDGEYIWSGRGRKWSYRMMADHPLLPEYEAGNTVPIQIFMNGWTGQEQGRPIMRVSGEEQQIYQTFEGNPRSFEQLTPIAAHELGAGRTLRLGFRRPDENQEPIPSLGPNAPFTFDDLIRRGVNWLAREKSAAE